MNALNSLIIEGKVIETSSDTDKTILKIAVDRSFRISTGENVVETNYFDSYFFGETFRKYLNDPVNKNVRIVGRLKQERFQDSGKEFSKVIIIGEHIEFKVGI